MRDAGVFISWYGGPCCCRCRHCSLRNGARISGVPYARAEAIAQRFIEWRGACGPTDFGVEFGGGYAFDYDELVRQTEFQRRHGMEIAHFLPMNGTRFRKRAEMRETLMRLKQAGVTKIGLTFFGIGEAHDAWSRRPGDFAHVLASAEVAAECGLERCETLFLVRPTLGQLSALIEILDRIAGPRERVVAPWDYRGRGKLIDDERVRADEIARVPADVRRFVSLERWRSEADWIERIAADDVPDKSTRWYMIPVWEDNVERLESADCGQLIEEMRDADDAFHRSIPPLRELAARYGDPRGVRLYALRDLEWKWTDAYLTEHPEIDATARFDDLTMCVLTR